MLVLIKLWNILIKEIFTFYVYIKELAKIISHIKKGKPKLYFPHVASLNYQMLCTLTFERGWAIAFSFEQGHGMMRVLINGINH